jgi:hypothetical protein
MRSVIRELFSDTSTRNSRERTFPLAPRLRYGARVKPRCHRFFAANFLLVFFLAFAAQRTGVAQTAIEALVWDAGAGRVSADIRTWDVRQMLDSLASQSGWEVFLQPDAKQTISAKFKDLTPGEALKKLLSELNYAVIPQRKGPTRLYVFRTKRDDATQRIGPPPAPPKQSKAIQNELIAVLRPGADAKKIAQSVGGSIKGRIAGLNAYRLAFDSSADARAALDSLASNDGVRGLDANFAIDRPTVPRFPAPAAPLPFSLRPALGPDGGTVIVGLIDTAVQRDGTPLGGFLLPAINVGTDAQMPNSQPTHSTAMAETILRSIAANQPSGATPVRILPVDVFGDSSSTTTFDIADGISQAVKSGARLINLSLASESDSLLLRTVIGNSASQGVVFFAAAGNTPTTAPSFPAAYPEVTAVTAVEKNGSLASYANRGAFVDVVASGTSLVQFNNQGWLVTGTSASTATATGFAASLVATAGKSAPEAQAIVQSRWSAKALVSSAGP